MKVVEFWQSHGAETFRLLSEHVGLVIASTAFPGWANIYLSPTTLGSIAMIITFGFAGGFTGAYFTSRGDP